LIVTSFAKLAVPRIRDSASVKIVRFILNVFYLG